MKNAFYTFCFLLFSHAYTNGQSIGIIGSATQQGWSEDLDLTQDATDPEKWSITLQLTEGECKFRRDDTWLVNWGASDFPVGNAVLQGANIRVENSAVYAIEFHSGTGAYRFSNVSEVGLLGDAAPFGSTEATYLISDASNPEVFTRTVDLKKGTCRFVFSTPTSTSLGSSEFPEGTASASGADIQIPKDDKYKVIFDRNTNAYRFEAILEVRSIQITGNAIPSTSDPVLNLSLISQTEWAGNLKLLTGNLVFQVNNNSNLIFASAAFPEGTATIGGSAIAVTAGEYRIVFDVSTGAYRFSALDYYTSIGLIGSATVSGWDSDNDLTQDNNDKTEWYGRFLLTDGEVKFRADDSWVRNWGAAAFPIGKARTDASNIPVAAGDYTVRFNSETGAYSFLPFMAVQKIGLVGNGAKMSNWNEEIVLNQDPTNPFHYSVSGVQLTDGDVKFRANQDLSLQWGAGQFPIGTGVHNGTNIPTQSGVYKVDFNYLTGLYIFSSLSNLPKTDEIAGVSMSPNPTNQWLNVQFDTQKEASIEVIDLQGRVLVQTRTNGKSISELDISGLQGGQYIVRIMTQNQVLSQKILKL
jgi:starch-binding outer membrane protein SusE/F